METEPREYQDVIDQALQLVYSHHHRLVSQLFPAAFQSLSMEQTPGQVLSAETLRALLRLLADIRASRRSMCFRRSTLSCNSCFGPLLLTTTPYRGRSGTPSSAE